VAWICPDWGPDMFGFDYWNLARKSDMSRFYGKLECKEFFDDLHFTN
jgi:hypothetical protein